MWLLAAFVLIPLLEIALFIQIGGAIGLWPTLLVVVVTAIVGTTMVRTQGAQAIARFRGSLETLRDPTEPLAHGAMILFAGALLLTPGFFTDAIGFALLIPPIRKRAYAFAVDRLKARAFTYGDHPSRRAAAPGPERDRHRPDVIDGEYTTVDPPASDDARGRKPSGWTRH